MSLALAALVNPKQIALNLRAKTREEAMREIVDLLVAADKIDNPEKFLEQLRARETTNSTYAADGVAFPHARTKLVNEIVLGIGRNDSSAIIWWWLARLLARPRIGHCERCCFTPKTLTNLSPPS